MELGEMDLLKEDIFGAIILKLAWMLDKVEEQSDKGKAVNRMTWADDKRWKLDVCDGVAERLDIGCCWIAAPLYEGVVYNVHSKAQAS